jgi:hypothetical protein
LFRLLELQVLAQLEQQQLERRVFAQLERRQLERRQQARRHLR